MGSLWPDRLVWNKHRLRRCSMTIEYQTYGLVFYGHRTPAAPVFILHRIQDHTQPYFISIKSDPFGFYYHRIPDDVLSLFE